MTFNYIQKWELKYIKDDLSSILLYFDYFSPGIHLPIILKNYQKIKYFFYKFFRIIIIVIFFTKLYKLVYKIIKEEENFIIKIIWEGNWLNTIQLVNINGEYKILKKVYNEEIYNKEKLFYDTYKNNISNIKLPKCIFHKDNIIEMEFIKHKTFEKLINEWYVGYNESIQIFHTIKKQIPIFYGSHTLIHWDFGQPNIFFISPDIFYLIDFSDCFEFDYNYDLYVLYKKINFSFHKILLKQKVLQTKLKEDFIKSLWITQEKLEIIENRYFKNRNIKHQKNI